MAVSHPVKKFGRKPTKIDRRTLRLAKYLNLAKLPPIPTRVDWSRIEWPMMGNDRYGCCVMSAIGHEIQEWTTFGAGSPRTPTDAQVINQYLALSPGDDGLVILDTLNLWRSQGFWNDKIDAYVALDEGDVTQAKAANYLFGNIHIGMSLPDQNTFGPWDTVTGPPDPSNGHAVTLVGYDDTGFFAVTWGEVIHLSFEWYQKYAGPYYGEAYAILSKDWLNSRGLSPDGFDYAALQQDLHDVTGDPPPPPPPPPPPTPGPGCLGALVGSLTVATLLYQSMHPHTTVATAIKHATEIAQQVAHALPPGLP